MNSAHTLNGQTVDPVAKLIKGRIHGCGIKRDLVSLNMGEPPFKGNQPTRSKPNHRHSNSNACHLKNQSRKVCKTSLASFSQAYRATARETPFSTVLIGGFDMSTEAERSSILYFSCPSGTIIGTSTVKSATFGATTLACGVFGLGFNKKGVSHV